MATLPAIDHFHSAPEVRPLPSAGVTRFQRYYGPLRHPARPGPSLTGGRLEVTRLHRGGLPVLRGTPVCQRACVDYSDSRIAEQVFGYRTQATATSTRAVQSPGVPRSRGGSAAAICVFGAYRTFTCVRARWLAESLARPFTPRASTRSLPPLLSGLLPATTPVTGWGCLPLSSHTLTRRTRETACRVSPHGEGTSRAVPHLARRYTACRFAFARRPVRSTPNAKTSG